LRIENNLKSADIVAAAKTVCPSFDKAMLSKVENGGKYGISIKPEIMNAIIKLCVPDSSEVIKRRIRGGNYLSKRVQCRLGNGDYERLQQRLKDSKYDTMQDYLYSLIKKDIKGVRT